MRRGDPLVATADDPGDRPVVDERQRHRARERAEDRARDDRAALRDRDSRDAERARSLRALDGSASAAAPRCRCPRCRCSSAAARPRCRRCSCAAAVRCPGAGSRDRRPRAAARASRRPPRVAGTAIAAALPIAATIALHRDLHREPPAVARERDRARQLHAERHALVGVEHDLAGERFDRAALAPLALHERLGGGLSRRARRLDLDLATGAAGDLHDAAIGELDAGCEQVPRRGDRIVELILERLRLVGGLRRALVPALVARPQIQLAVRERDLAAVVRRSSCRPRDTRLCRRARSPFCRRDRSPACHPRSRASPSRSRPCAARARRSRRGAGGSSAAPSSSGSLVARSTSILVWRPLSTWTRPPRS